MPFLAQSVYVSLAYKPGSLPVGGNWKIEVGGDVEEHDLAAPLAEFKALLDHRCLFTDLPEFATRPSTAENVARLLAAKLFARSPRWSFLAIYETEDWVCVARKDGLEIQQKVLNLNLCVKVAANEESLMTSRDRVTQSVIDLYRREPEPNNINAREWATSLFAKLRGTVPGLDSLRVDLGGGKYIVVK